MKDKVRNLIFIFTLVIIIVASLTVSELVRLRASYVRGNPIATAEATAKVEVSEPPAMPEPEATYEPAVTEAPAPKDDEALSVLLIGNDGRRGAEGALDTLAAARYEKTDGALKLIVLSRELYVNIPGQGWGSLGRAYELGGMELLGETVRYNFGIELDGCLAADYEGLGAIVDALGGIEIELSADEAAPLGLEEGLSRLDGEQALSYLLAEGLEIEVMEERQLAVVLSVIDAMRELNAFECCCLRCAPLYSHRHEQAGGFPCRRVYNSGVSSIEKYSTAVGDYEGKEGNISVYIPIWRKTAADWRMALGDKRPHRNRLEGRRYSRAMSAFSLLISFTARPPTLRIARQKV